MRHLCFCVAALSLTAPAFAAGGTTPAPPAEKKVCKREQTHELGSHMLAPKVCLTEREWDAVEAQTQRDLRRSAQKGLNPTPIQKGR
jgi:hypothetical protein